MVLDAFMSLNLVTNMLVQHHLVPNSLEMEKNAGIMAALQSILLVSIKSVLMINFPSQTKIVNKAYQVASQKVMGVLKLPLPVAIIRELGKYAQNLKVIVEQSCVGT